MLIIEAPAGCTSERGYIADVVFGDWFGLPYRVVQDERSDVRLRLSGQPGEMRLPDTFFRQFVAECSVWLSAASLPSFQPGSGLPCWNPDQLAPGAAVTTVPVPVLCSDFSFAEDGTCLAQAPLMREERGAPELTLPLDIFGSAFFMLSRYEEAVLTERDGHGRFPASASLAYRAGFLDRPLVDEYVEILWAAMRRLWPGLKRAPLAPRVRVSCDVDSPFAFSGRPVAALRSSAADVLRRRSPGAAVRKLRGHWRAHRGDHDADPHFAGIEFIMSVNERAGHPVAFYFIPEPTNAQYDRAPRLDDPRMRQLLADIHARGHEVGIHPGYDSCSNPEVFSQSVSTFRRVLEELAFDAPRLGGRQHYLRWQTPATARLWQDNGLAYDSTLGYAESPGFRCGTCREYTLYDPVARRELALRESPLIVMECSVLAEKYLGIDSMEAALSLMQGFRDRCLAVGGEFTLLWHNTTLSSAAERQVYEALLA